MIRNKNGLTRNSTIFLHSSHSMAPTSKKSNGTSKAVTGKSSSTESGPKTPVNVTGAPKTSAASKGHPRKTKGKENETDDSPLGGGMNTSTLVPSSDPPTGEDGPTTVAEENQILRERLATAECELCISIFHDLTYLCSEPGQGSNSRTQASA